MCKSEGREGELSDVVRVRLVLAGFLGEAVGLGFALRVFFPLHALRGLKLLDVPRMHRIKS